MILAGIFVLLQFTTDTSAVLSSINNVYCGARPAVVEVNSNGHNYFPYYVMLHRCEGSASGVTPSVKKCVAKTHMDVAVMAFSLSTGQTKQIHLQNHTSCRSECVMKESMCDPNLQFWQQAHCSCGCKYPAGPPTPCPSGFSWDSNSCKCKCHRPPKSCGPNEEWSPDLCDCTCAEKVIKRCALIKKSIEYGSCSCVDIGSVGNGDVKENDNSHLYITLLVLETVVVIVLIYALVHWIRKKRGLHQQATSKFHGSQEPLSPQTRTFDYEDGKRKNGAEFVVLEVDSKAQVKDQDLKSATPKESDNRKN